PARRGWSARDFRARNIRCAHARGLLFPSFRPTSGSSPWRFCLLFDETAHAQLSQFLLRAAETATEAVRPSYDSFRLDLFYNMKSNLAGCVVCANVVVAL